MRLWVRPEDRRPDPEPIRTDDRTPVLVGMGGWIVALALFLLFLPTVLAGDHAWWLWTALVGLGIGVLLIVYLAIRER